MSVQVGPELQSAQRYNYSFVLIKSLLLIMQGLFLEESVFQTIYSISQQGIT